MTAPRFLLKETINSGEEKPEKCSPRQFRHLDFIAQFSTDIQYVPGGQNVVADALSRVDTIHATLDYKSLATSQQTDEELKVPLQGTDSGLHLKLLQMPESDVRIYCDVSTRTARPFITRPFRRTAFNSIHQLSHPSVNTTIRNIKQQETSSDAVQQGEVSSSKPTVITNEVLGPLLLEALEGFLFVVNPDGYVNFCTENIKSFIRYSRQEVLGKSVYNLIHHGDHARFHNCLVPSSHQVNAWTSDSGGQAGKRPSLTASTPNRTFNIRLLVKPADEQQETMEEKQQRVYQYENMQISSTHLTAGLSRGGGENGQDDSGDVSSEGGPCLMCVARRIPPTDKQLSAPIEQFTMKLDRSGTIIGMDTSGVSQTHTQYLNKDLKGRRVQDLCHSVDLPKFSAHLNQTITQGTASLHLYRLRVSSDRYLHVQIKSKLFRSAGGEQDFIMATHSIINDSDVAVVLESLPQQQAQLSLTQHTTSSSNTSALGSSTSSGLGSTSSSGLGSSSSGLGSTSSGLGSTSSGLGATSSGLGSTSSGLGSSSGLGGPMMSAMNGTAAPPPPPAPSPPPTTFQSFNLMEEFDYFPSTTWEMDPWSDRPESRHSEPPTPSPLSYHPSPVPANPPSTPSYNAFPFSPMPQLQDDKQDTKEGITEMDGGSDSAKLRNALMQRPTSVDSDEGSNTSAGAKNKNRILKDLLNNPGDPHDIKQQDEENKATNNNNNNNSSNNNNMLLCSLLNTNKDDDPVKKNQLLSQLLKEDEKMSSGPLNSFNMSNSHSALQSSLHLTSTYKNIFREMSSSPSSPETLVQGRPRKRPSEESDDGNVAKRPASILDTIPSPIPSAAAHSELQKKNKMLASLLAQEPKNAHQPVPLLPADIISATPQEKLPRVVKSAPTSWSGGTVQQQQTKSIHQGRASLNLVDWGEGSWPMENQDRQLSEILDGVIDIIPDEFVDPSNQYAVDEILSFISASSNAAKRNLPQEQAIRQIKKSLMQICDEATPKPPSYHLNLTQQQSQSQGPPPPQLSHLHPQSVQPPQQQAQYPPPPMYQQRPRFSMQQAIRSGNPQYAISNQAPLTPQMLQQRQKMIQQQRQRLLQQQQQQQVVIPPSHAQADHNMDSLINNTVAPNVSLQRSNSVPDSPSGYNLLGNSGPNGPNSNPAGQMSPRSQPNQQNPYPPSFSNGLRLSPGSPYQGTQLSPRVSQSGGQTPNYSQQNTWSPQQQQAQVTNSNQTRLSIQQQQNPMLSAQLTGNSFPVTTRVTTAGGNTSGYLSQQQQSPGQSQPGAQQRLPSQQPSQLPGVRSLTSPGARHSPFPPEVSPNTAASYQQGAQFRLGQRASGPQTPTATTHLPGAGIRHYNAMSPHHVYSPDQSSSPYCYDSPLVYQDRGRMGMSPGSVPGPPPNVGSGTNNGVTDYVRQEIRAIVGARQQGPRSTQQIQVGPGQSVSAADCEALGLYLEMPSGGNESPKMWASLPSGDMGVTSPPHRNSSDSNGSDQKNSSLLQKLLSE
ncbi:hypothetical protein M8J77_007124 [Diaphorina citri]|nr:hypothetical protein M8J77_007124 [Diaphorina citri]